mgnify:FL=1|jgi:hypothetical protein
MSIYRITVREISSIEYSVEADSEAEARDLIGMGDQRIANEHIVDWDIIEIEEYNPRLDPDDIAEIQSAMQENADDRMMLPY